MYTKDMAGRGLGKGRGTLPLTQVDENGRVCTACGEYKLWSEFYKKPPKGKLAHSARCKTCEQVVQKATQQTYYLRRKQKVIDAYGGRCACCGETELVFLTIDHINGDGGAHRKELGAKTVHLSWYITHGFPAGFQVLCANCHLGKTILGACPHSAAPDWTVTS